MDDPIKPLIINLSIWDQKKLWQKVFYS